VLRKVSSIIGDNSIEGAKRSLSKKLRTDRACKEQNEAALAAALAAHERAEATAVRAMLMQSALTQTADNVSKDATKATDVRETLEVVRRGKRAQELAAAVDDTLRDVQAAQLSVTEFEENSAAVAEVSALVRSAEIPLPECDIDSIVSTADKLSRLADKMILVAAELRTYRSSADEVETSERDLAELQKSAAILDEKVAAAQPRCPHCGGLLG
jgi:glutamine synthetase type III